VDETVLALRKIEVVASGSTPQAVGYRAVRIMCSGAYLAEAGQVNVMLGRDVAVPITLPAASPGLTEIFTLYDGVMPVEVSECSLSVPLAGGSISLILVQY
jgi:hypothetical protein